jgi:hypothetical protein
MESSKFPDQLANCHLITSLLLKDRSLRSRKVAVFWSVLQPCALLISVYVFEWRRCLFCDPAYEVCGLHIQGNGDFLAYLKGCNI